MATRSALQRLRRVGLHESSMAASPFLRAHHPFSSSSRATESVGGFWGFLGRLVIGNLTTAQRKVFADQLHPPPAPPAPLPPVEVVREVIKEVVREVQVKVPVEVLVPAPPPPPPPEHPVLGQLLFDFGWKRIYSMDPVKLCDARLLPVWNLQRSFRLDRAETIAKAKLKRPEVGFPGVISIYELPAGAAGNPGGTGGGEEGFRAILDGQHRVGALRLMASRGGGQGQGAGAGGGGGGGLPPSHSRVLAEVFPLGSEAEAESLFVEINQAQPVLLVDMPSSGGGAPNDAKAALEEAALALKARFPAMFSQSQQCKAPHLNVDTLKDKLFQVDVLLTHNLSSGKELLDWLLAENERLSARPDEEWLNDRPAASKKSGDVQYKKALQKARQHGLFLGLDSWKWLESRGGVAL